MIFINGRQEVEAGLLSSLINSNGEFVKHKRNISPEYFSNGLHKKLYQALLLIHSEGGKFDLLTIKTAGNLSSEDVCTLSEINMLECSGRNLGLYVKKLTELIAQDKINNFKLTKHEDCFDAQDEMQKLNLELSRLFNSHTRRPKDVMLSDFEKYLSDNQTKGVKRIKTPFPTLNKMLSGGFSPGSFVVIGGLPGIGKSTIMLQFALDAAVNGWKAHFIEAEMSEADIFERCCGILTENDIDEIRCGVKYAGGAIAQLQALPIDFHFDCKRTLSNLINEVELAAVNGAKIIFIDYLQVYAEYTKVPQEKFLSVQKVSESLRQISLKYNIVLIAGSSFNRNEKDLTKPGLVSLYGSSGLGHDASQVLLLHGEQKDENEIKTRKRDMLLLIVKNRTGVRGDINLKYYLASQKMVELETRF